MGQEEDGAATLGARRPMHPIHSFLVLMRNRERDVIQMTNFLYESMIYTS